LIERIAFDPTKELERARHDGSGKDGLADDKEERIIGEVAER